MSEEKEKAVLSHSEALGLVDASFRSGRNGPLFAKGQRGAISVDGKESTARHPRAGAAAYDGRLGLHGATEPSYQIISEKPEHRFLVYLRAQGMSVVDIFRKLGGVVENGNPQSGSGQYSYPWLCQISRQDWFRKRVVELMEEAGKDRLTALLESEVVPSVETLIELRDNGRTDTVRLNATNSLIDRVLGKATQVVRSDSTVTYKNAEEEKAALEREEVRLRELVFN